MVEDAEVEICYEGEVVSRKEAVKGELKRYFTGRWCKHRHVAQRITNSGRCCECNRLSTLKWRKESKSKGSTNTYNSFKTLPDLKDLYTWLSYDETSGNLYWNIRDSSEFASEKYSKMWNSQYPNTVADYLHYSNNYVEVRLPNGKLYKAHRLVWKMFYGKEPKMIIDHINGVGSDNRIVNLREATHKDNSRNMKIVGNINYKGVTLDKEGRYVAAITVNDSRIPLGEYATLEDAARAYDNKAKELFKEFAHLNFPEEE